MKVTASRQVLVTIMGKAFSGLVRRPVRNWNVENRAQKVIQKIETKGGDPAPLHPSTRQQVEAFRQDHPEYLEAQQVKHEGLHDRLKGLVVNPERVQEITSSLKPLPADRAAVKDFEYGYPEPLVVTAGRCSFKQFLDMLSRYHSDPMTDSPTVLAEEYKVNPEQLTQVLKHFCMYQIQFPKDKKALLEGNEVPDAKPVSPGFKMQLLGRKKDSSSDKTETSSTTK